MSGFEPSRKGAIVAELVVEWVGGSRPVDKARGMLQHNDMERMSLHRFGRFVARVMETLPEEFLPFLDNVVVDVEEEPDRETLTEEEIAAGERVYGAFALIDLPSLWGGDAVDLNDLPDRLIIYKKPLEEDFPDLREMLLQIRKTVVHELAHHFGWSERDLDRFEETPNPFPDELAEE